jgi:hypothetical protein
MTAFWIGVAASLVATYLAAFFSKYLPHRVQTVMQASIGRLLGVGINYVYKDEEKASRDMLRDAARSKSIQVLSIRGFRLTSEGRPLSKLLGKDVPYNDLKVMIADPRSPAVLERSQGFTDTALMYPQDNFYAEDVTKSINVLIGAAKANRRIHVRTHHQCESFRLFITDDSLYLSFFPKGRSASTSPVYKIKRDCLLYNAFATHFLWMWQYNSIEHSSPIILTKDDK